MTDELDNLRPEVAYAVKFIEGVRIFVTSKQRIKKPEGDDLFDQSFATIRAELLRLAEYEQAAGRLAIEKAELRQCAEQCEAELAAMPDADEWHALRERAEHAEAELAALKARIAEAPWTTAQDTYIGHRYALVHYAMDERHCGKRVRLLVEE